MVDLEVIPDNSKHDYVHCHNCGNHSPLPQLNGLAVQHPPSATEHIRETGSLPGGGWQLQLLPSESSLEESQSQSRCEVTPIMQYGVTLFEPVSQHCCTVEL